jgi:hypothetical protein
MLVMIMRISLMRMAMRVVMAVIMAVMVMPVSAMIIGAALGLERTPDFLGEPPLPAHHLGKDMVRLDIDRVGGKLGWGVAVADMPGDAREAQRVLGGDLEQLFRRGANGDEAAILQLQRVAIADEGRLVEVEQEIEPLLALQHDAALLAVVMIERDHINDLLGPDGGLADDARGAKHDWLL